jgi:NADH:ubiquinone reductase (H+-translocating)
MAQEPERTDRIEGIVVAGAGYAGLHATLRLAARLDDRHREVGLTLVDRYDYHQVLTELPRVAGGQRTADEVRVPLRQILDERVRFVQTSITGFDFAGRRLLTEAGPLPYSRLVLALGSRPNDFGIPGLAERALTLWSVEDARKVLAAIDTQVAAAVGERDPEEQRRRMTVVIGGGGATGVELAGELAEELPDLARRHGLDPALARVILIDAGPTILAGSSPGLIDRATSILRDLKVEVRTNSMIARATEDGFVLKSGDLIRGGVFVWAGGIKAPELVSGSGLPVGNNGRVKVDQYLRALDHPQVYVAGDLASVTNPATGRVYAPTAQIALSEGETVANNLLAELDGRPLEPFTYNDRGFVVSVGPRSGVADVAGRTIGGRLAHLLKDAIEWEYRQSVKHLRGWSPTV